MKIRQIRREYYSWPRKHPIRNALNTWDKVDRCVLYIDTEDGLTGVGIGGASPGEVAILDVFCELLPGHDASMIGAIYKRLNQPVMIGRSGQEHFALSTIDMALWDLKAKSANMPMHRLLGGVTNRVPFYIAGGYYGKDKTTSDLQNEVESYVKTGAKGVKIKVGAVPVSEDEVRVKAVREVLGPDRLLFLDANGAFRAHEAINFGERMAKYDIAWFEEPVRCDDYEGYRRVGEKLTIPIAGGELEYGLAGFRTLIATGALSILQPDARCAGGVSEFLRISNFADAHGLVISSHSDQQVHAPLMASIQNPYLAEYYLPTVDPHAADFYLAPLKLYEDGHMAVSEEPGGGWDVNTKAMQKFRVK